MSAQPVSSGRVLLTGATGYIGGRLLTRLEHDGVLVRCLARKPGGLRSRVAESTEIVQGDVQLPDTLAPALAGIDTAFYLVHSMNAGSDYSEKDRQGAENFARACETAGVKRIIYLGGLGSGEGLSSHLASRQEVGSILRAGSVPTIELRSSVVIGSGSLSFELIRSLVDRLPVMVTPRWVRVRTQPIAVEDVIEYLVEAIKLPLETSTVFEIGGREPVTYQDLMLEYARQRGIRRFMIPVPVLTPRLSSLWLALVTPVYARVGRALVEGLRHDTTVQDNRALTAFAVRPRGLSSAVERALKNEDADFASTRWSDSLSFAETSGWGGKAFGSRLVDSRTRELSLSAPQAFGFVEAIGGPAGWYHANWLWRARGLIDLAFGGPGLRRGRRHPQRLQVGDTVDFWRVEAIEPPSLLRLAAEMRLPGRAWLQYEITPSGQDSSTIRQTAIFDPVGLPGLAYWYLVYPLHAYVFKGMLNGMADNARRVSLAGSSASVPLKDNPA